MSEDDIRQHLSRALGKLAPVLKPKVAVRPMPRRQKPQATFKNFSATHLFCPQCKRATEVRERLLLYLPDGNLFDYNCSECGTSVGTRKGGG